MLQPYQIMGNVIIQENPNNISIWERCFVNVSIIFFIYIHYILFFICVCVSFNINVNIKWQRDRKNMYYLDIVKINACFLSLLPYVEYAWKKFFCCRQVKVVVLKCAIYYSFCWSVVNIYWTKNVFHIMKHALPTQ